MEYDFLLDLPFPLSKEQRNIVCENSRNIKVEAAAGTGKTETIARKIIYSILADNIDPKRIVAFTFTEKAAKEMKTRVYELANSLGNNEIPYQLNEMYIGTIHAYCKNILEDFFSYADYNLFDDNKEIAYLLRIGWELGIDKYENSYTRSVLEFHKTKNMFYNELINESDLKNFIKNYLLLGRSQNGLNSEYADEVLFFMTSELTNLDLEFAEKNILYAGFLHDLREECDHRWGQKHLKNQ